MQIVQGEFHTAVAVGYPPMHFFEESDSSP